MKHLYLRLAVLLMAVGIPIHFTMAQTSTTSAMNGLITDNSGGGLPGATVIAIHTPTNTQYAATTNNDGRYNIQNMRVGGPYTVKTTYVGYQDQTRENINLSLGQNLKLDFTIAESSIGLGEVEVVGTRSTVINADRTGAATSVTAQQIQTLPTLSRSIQDFTRLTPQANGNGFAGRSSSFNNISIDGALFNNAFGLSGNLGGQTNANPISLDAIDQIQVQIAPYDVRQGSFTGAGINAVTRSGANDFSGSVYYFSRTPGLVGRDVGDQHLPKQQFDLSQLGFRLGGPVIKDKLFFFVNYERERRTDPATTFLARRPGLAGTNVTTVDASVLDELSLFLNQKFGYQTGGYENYDFETNSDKATVKIDWNINAKSNFSLKYNFLDSYRDQIISNSGGPSGNRQPGVNTLPFQSSGYAINNNFNSFIGELNTKISDKYSNNLIVGYTGLRDFRSTTSSLFPLVEIENGAGLSLTSFGYEPFTAFNILDSDIYQLSDNLTLALGKHVVTLGTSNEAYHFRNGFAPNYYGRYRYRNIQDFYDAVNTNTPRASQYQVQYAASPSGEFPYAEIDALQLGFYAQDEFSPLENVKITFGLRTDIPIINTELPRNEPLENLTFREGRQVDVSQFQKTTPLWSPRVGFNVDVNNDQKTQVRGGTGIFTGRVPYVWISNQASNNGVLFGSISNSASGTAYVPNLFSPNVGTAPDQADTNPNLPVSRTASSSYNIAVTSSDFKFPQVFRTNLALDQKLPFGIVATLEGIFTKDLNAVYHQNINLPEASFRPNGPDNRPTFWVENRNATGAITYAAVNRIYGGTIPSNNTPERPNISDVILMRNSNKGYSYALTGQLQKQFENGLYAMAAYTYSDARSVNDGGSIAQSIWRDRQVSGDPNANALSYSNFLQRHRIVAAISYRKEYLNRLATSVGLFVDAGPNFRYSYTYAGDMNGDGQSNDLIYIPRDANEIVFEDVKDARTSEVLYSAADQSRDFFSYVSQDKYLRENQGKYAERNGAESPWVSNFDLKITQDIFQNIGGKKNTLQFSLDLFNLGNRLNSDWGVRDNTIRASILSFRRIEAAAGPNQGKPVFQFPYQDANTKQVLSTSYRDATTEVSRWRAQLGIRYIFN